MKIAISGCGIAGTAAAAFLAGDGHDVTVYEQAPQCQPIGAGIMLQASGQKVLGELGLLKEVATQSAPLDGLDAFLCSGIPLIRLRYEMLCKPMDGSPAECVNALGVHRGLLFQQLLRACSSAGARVVTSTKVARYETNSNSVTLVDDAGRMLGPFDFLVAADGSRSRLRTASGIRSHSIEYPYGALWATGPCSTVSKRLHQVIDGTDRLVGLLPIGNDTCSFFWGLRRDRFQGMVQSNFEAFRSEASQMCPQATELLESFESFQQMTFSTYRHVRMSTSYADRVVFIGDAAHPSSPHLGQGVNLALEDASCFASTLRECRDFPAACRIHHQRRRAKIRYYQQLTRLLTPFFQSDIRLLGPVLAPGRNITLPWFPKLPWVRRKMLRTLCGVSTGWFSK